MRSTARFSIERLNPRAAVLVLFFLAVGLHAETARAESGRFNLHLELGPATALVANTSTPPPDASLGVGGLGWLAIDWQFSQPFALEVLGGAGLIPGYFGEVEGGKSWRVAGHGALGIRWRPLDNFEGYANEERGDHAGNFWISAHVGALGYSALNLAFAPSRLPFAVRAEKES